MPPSKSEAKMAVEILRKVGWEHKLCLAHYVPAYGVVANIEANSLDCKAGRLLEAFKEEFAEYLLVDLRMLLKPKSANKRRRRALCDSDASYYDDANWEPQNRR